MAFKTFTRYQPSDKGWKPRPVVLNSLQIVFVIPFFAGEDTPAGTMITTASKTDALVCVAEPFADVQRWLEDLT